jgi:hypothetical protein
MQGLCARRQNQTPLSQKVKFAVYSEKHLKQLIDDITDLTNDLVTLFPGKPEFGEDQKKLCSDEVREFTKSLRELAEAVKGNDKLLSAALSEILKPAVSPIRVPRFILLYRSRRARIALFISTSAMATSKDWNKMSPGMNSTWGLISVQRLETSRTVVLLAS